MDHQQYHSGPHSFALRVQPGDSQLEEIESHEEVGRESKVQDFIGTKGMSYDEARIREELERDIEKHLEGEIKDEMYRLALRLHRLYQHQKEKNNASINHSITSTNNALNHIHTRPQLPAKLKQHKNKDDKSKALSEVNISIKMEGDTKVEIKEIKKPEIIDHGHAKLHVDNKHNNDSSNNTTRRFDWTTSLRSELPKSCDLVVRHKKGINGKERPKTPRHSKGKKCANTKLTKLPWK